MPGSNTSIFPSHAFNNIQARELFISVQKEKHGFKMHGNKIRKNRQENNQRYIPKYYYEALTF